MRDFLYEKRDGIKSGKGRFCPASIWTFFFNRDGISGQDGMTELVDKTALPNSIFKFDSSFFNNFICEIKSTNVFEHLWLTVLNYLWEKQPPRTDFAICVFSKTGSNVLNILLYRRQSSWKALLKNYFYHR